MMVGKLIFIVHVHFRVTRCLVLNGGLFIDMCT